MKRLVIAIDPGFDGCKIVINEQTYDIPFVVEEITSVVSSFPMARGDNSFIRCEMDGKLYLLGEYARKSLLEVEHLEKARASMDTFYTIGRFGTKLFEVGINAFMGYALLMYEEYSSNTKEVDTFKIADMDSWDIHVGIALPHEHQEDLWSDHIKGYLKAHHEFKLFVGATEGRDFSFDLKEENCVYNSQAVCALIDAVTDDKGMMIEDEKTLYDYLPAIILDGGYKTLGKFKLSRDGRMDKAESNADFAMNNINEAVAAEIRKKVPNTYAYMIEERYNKNEPVYYEEEGEVESFDIVEMRNKETKKKAIELMNYLMTQHGGLLDIKLILLAGGTGAAYFDTVKEFIDSKRSNLKDKVWLAKNGFNGDECEPVFAIAIGLYKAMINALS